MEGTGILPEEREINTGPNRARIAAGVGVLVVLILIAVLLAPPYYHNWQLEQYVKALAHDPGYGKQPPDLVRALVMDRAASLGLPVRTSDVHIETSGKALKIEVLYIVHIDLPVYTVDLHFRPGAG